LSTAGDFASAPADFNFPGDSLLSLLSLPATDRSFFTLTPAAFFFSLPSLRSLRMSRAFCFLALLSRLEELESRLSFFFTFCLRSLSFFLSRGESVDELVDESVDELLDEEEEEEEEEDDVDRRRFSLFFSSSICLASSRCSSSLFLSMHNNN
jgi:hypothetical protein